MNKMKQMTQNNFNKSRNNPLILKNNFNVSNISDVNDLTLNHNYKKFDIRQLDMHLDSKMFDLIAKMNNEKMYETAKSQFDEDKKILLSQTSKKLYRSNSDYFLNNHLNINNFQAQLNKLYTYDAADNLLIHSFFDKIKTRKRKVFRLKQNHYIDILYQGSSSPKKNKNKPKKEKPKFDFRLLLKSNSDIEAYLKRKQDKLKARNVALKSENDKEDELNKSFDEENKVIKKQEAYRSYRPNDKIIRLFNYKRGRRSIDKQNNLQKADLSIIQEENKYLKSTTKLPNIKDKNNPEISKDYTEKENYNDNKSKTKNNFFSDKSNKKDKADKTLILESVKNSIQMKLFKNNVLKITKLNKDKDKEKSLSKESESKIQSNPTKKTMSRTTTEKFLKDKITTIKFKLNDNERIQYMNRLNKQKFNKVISDFNEKEKKLEKKFMKINKSINNLKTGKKSAKSASRNKSRDKNKKLIESKRIESPKRNRLLMFKEWNEATSLFHFPLINKVIYKNKKNCDNIDKIKSNLKKEYSHKLKRNRKEYTRKIDGKKIMMKLNDRYEIERLREYSEDLREKQRKREKFEIIEL